MQEELHASSAVHRVHLLLHERREPVGVLLPDACEERVIERADPLRDIGDER